MEMCKDSVLTDKSILRIPECFQTLEFYLYVVSIRILYMDHHPDNLKTSSEKLKMFGLGIEAAKSQLDLDSIIKEIDFLCQHIPNVFRRSAIYALYNL